MHSMLNQFYKYMANKLLEFLKEQELEGGERYYLQFDEEKNVNEFYQTLKNLPEAQEFIYTHEYGTPYKTFSILVEDIKVVVAATINDVTPDFLVTLRNLVSDQEGLWTNTALISISHQSLDSIRGGSKDLQQKGMPFNVKSITNYIKEELDYNAHLAISEKEIIKFHLDKKLEDIVIQTSLWDYAEIIALINKGEVVENDFKSLHLFPDKELGKNCYLKQQEIRSRLNDNHRLFETVQRIHDYETLDTELEKYFDEKMIPALKKDDWYTAEFSQVKNAYDNVKRSLQYLNHETKKLNKNIVYWEKPQSETKPGQRKRHIIVFNENKDSAIEMSFEFDDYLKKQFIEKRSAPFASVSGKKLKVVLPCSDEITFHKIKYKHNNENQSAYEFNFCIVPFSERELEGIESIYEVKIIKSNNYILLKYEDEKTSIGSGEIETEYEIKEPYETIKKNENEKLIISVDSGAWEDDSLSFNLSIAENYLTFEFKDTDIKSYPITASRVWKLKRENREHFYLENDRLKQGTSTYYPHEDFKTTLLLEKEWIENNYLYISEDEKVVDAPLPMEIQNHYLAYLSYFSNHNRLPSLSYFDDELQRLAENYIATVIESIQKIKEDSLLSSEQKNIFRLGTIKKNNKIWLTPLHPLNVVYQLNMEKTIGDEILDNTILERLHPRNLLPFIYSDKDKLFRPTMNAKFPEWHEYEPEKLVTVGSANEYLANVVEEKMKQFIHHFEYLFLESAHSPLLLNIIQIHNDKEVVRGICNFLKKRLESKGPSGIVPIQVGLYREEIDSPSYFEIFSSLQTPAEVEAEFNINLSSKDFDSVDVLRLIREHINYYKIELSPSTDFSYAHISFFKIPTQDIDASHPVDKLETGISLDGIISSVVSIASDSDYRTGFGLLNAPDNKNDLITLAACYNELSFNLQNEGINSYTKNKSIVLSTSTEGKALLNKLYKCSNWVTFIDSGVDLDFFQKSSPDLLVIHYNDQYTSSDSYDAITVTDKSKQYKNVITDYLSAKVKVSDKNIDLAIKSFNSINGEWLLSIIGSKGHFAREKISIIAAMKYLESYFHHPNITWVPISLEEILRVASATKLNKTDGIFSAKNLNSTGKHSDDILLMGIEEIEDSLYLHVYPVEVKIGSLQTRKANIQIEKTSRLFKEALIDKPNEVSFKKKFFRNFFAQILLSNAKKLHSNGLWSDEKYNQIHQLKVKLLNDQFKVAQHLEKFIGQGAVLTFRKDHGFRSSIIENNILKLDFIEEDAYAGLVMDKQQIQEKMTNGFMDFVPEKLLYHLYDHNQIDELLKEVSEYNLDDDNQNIPLESDISEEQEKSIDDIDNESDICEDSNKIVPIEKLTPPTFMYDEPNDLSGHASDGVDNAYYTDTSGDVESDNNQEKQEAPQIPLSDIRVPIGSIVGSNQTLYWEFGNPLLANRHLSITGRSGQGKTYFIQCLLWELSKNGISSIVIDYTDGYKKSQLEDEFKDKLGSNLEQFIVLAKKFPVNPFKRNQKILDEDLTILEDDSDVAERIKNVIGSIYPTLGIQQLNAIYQAVMKGMSMYDDKMNLFKLRELLEEDGSGPAKTAVSQMNLLIDKNPFDYEKDFDWSFLEKEKGKVFIIQLTGYSPDVQKMITEFILWDLWYYKLQHGNKNLPFPVVLDESQRLDFSNDAPSSKILVEGRKFGWSGWFSTQFLKGFSSDSISRLQNAAVKIYFAPMENEVSTIAANLTQDPNERKEWEIRLKNLSKGQCIVYGPIQDRDGNLLSPRPYLVDISSFEKR